MSESLEPHRRALWALAYRMTGDAAAADDLVQEAFRRWLERGPHEDAAATYPWLVRVLTNLAIDLLRRRKRRPYVGTWLPTPVTTEELERAVAAERLGPEARYDALESLTHLVLSALERLAPRPRAVVVLRDALGYPGSEVAEVLGTSEGNVRVQLHRARKVLAADAAPLARPPDATRAQRALERFLAALAAGDFAAVERMLAADVVTENDANGRFHAAVRPLRGAKRVARFLADVSALRQGLGAKVAVVSLNGLPALATCFDPALDPRIARHVVLGLDLDGVGAIARVWAVLGQDKLGRVPALG